MTMCKRLSLWKRLLFLLALSRRYDAIIAFVHIAPRTSVQPSSKIWPRTCRSTHYDKLQLAAIAVGKHPFLDIATAPLGHLIHLEDDDIHSSCNGSGKYQLVSPADDELPLLPNQRLVCIGDVHGDYQALVDFLTLAQVYDPTADGSSSNNKQEWIGGNTILVQCGDVLDRGSEELACFQLLTRLSQQAAAQGGSVILLWGNHEAMNAAGMFHDTTGGEEYERELGKRLDEQLQTEKWRLQFAGNQPARWAAYEPGNGILAHPLLANMKVAVKVGRTVCVHAGLTTAHLDEYGGLRGMNEQARTWMKQSYHGQKNNNLGDYESRGAWVYDVQRRAQLNADRMPHVLGGGQGANCPVWMRDYSFPNDSEPRNAAKAQQMIDGVLFHLQADRMVMGHTVQRKINAALQGKAWRVDVGASRGVMNGTAEVLEVVAAEDGSEVVSILTRLGKVPGEERQVKAATTIAPGINTTQYSLKEPRKRLFPRTARSGGILSNLQAYWQR